jgi:hypothetical protein
MKLNYKTTENLHDLLILNSLVINPDDRYVSNETKDVKVLKHNEIF